jgi:hypothetical protein
MKMHHVHDQECQVALPPTSSGLPNTEVQHVDLTIWGLCPRVEIGTR